MHRHRSTIPRQPLFGIAFAVAVLVALSVGVLIGVAGKASDGPPSAAQRADYANVLPAPVSAVAVGGQFVITPSTEIHISPGSAAARSVADYLASLLRPATGYAVPVTNARSSSSATTSGGIGLVLTDDKQLGAEGYRLDVADNQVTIKADQPSGLFHGVQTLRQLLPPQVEKRSAQKASSAGEPHGAEPSWAVPSGHILDYPRFTYRAAGLDVARHFFSVADVQRYIDEISLYKVNYLHLHLTDDQGWRLAINGWPKLTTIGAATEVGGGPGGFYTQDDYRKLVAYAQSRYITIVPEIDIPGHVTAALASYPTLSCHGKPQQVFTGIDSGFSSLCASKPTTYTFIDDVFRQLAALTPGPYIGIGGDEAKATSPTDYAKIVSRAASVVRAQGKVPWGWQETVAASDGSPPAISNPAASDPPVATYWNPGPPTPQLVQAANSGTRLVLDPASHTYLDQKYNADTTLGLKWAGYVDVQDTYNWDPATYLPGVNASSVLGVEADLWTETIAHNSDIDYMAFPRLPAVAELGWSSTAVHHWTAFQSRLAAQGPRWSLMGIGYYHSAQIPWPAGS